MSELSEPSVGESDQQNSPAILFGVLAAGITLLFVIVRFGGWLMLFKLLSLPIMVAAAVGAISFGVNAANSRKADDRAGAGILSGLCAVAALAAFWFIFHTSNGSNPVVTATTTYWRAVPECLNPNRERIESRAQLIRVFHDAATRIEQLPTKDVDPAAIEWGLEYAASMRQFASAGAANEAEDQQLLVRSFFHGFSGNIPGGIEDIASTVGRGGERARAAAERLEYVWDHRRAQVRAHLESKYGTPFP